MLKIGIIGMGRVSQKHIHGILKTGKAEISAICDIDENKLKESGDSLNIPEEYRFKDYHDLIACDEVEAVEICTPNYLHVPMATAVAKAGKPVQIEKPLGTSMNEGVSELLEAIKENNVINMMDFSYRFQAATRYAKHLIDQGKLGKLINVNAQYLQSGVFIPDRRLEWRFVKEYTGSGTLGDLGAHLIDMTRLLTGEFKSIYAMQSTVVKERMKLDSDEYAPVDVDDITSFIAKLESDVIVNFMVTKCSRCDGNTIIYELYGTNGVVKFNLNNPDEIEMCIVGNDVTMDETTVIKVPDEFYLEEQECFVRTVLGEDLPYYPDINDGIAVQKILDAAMESAECGKVIEL